MTDFVHQSLSEMVTEYIKNKILLGEYKEGYRVIEAKIAEELGISRAPVREGIKELENQGLIKIVPRKGTFVTRMSPEDVREIFDIRLLLENDVLEILIRNRLLSAEDFATLENIIQEMVLVTLENADEAHKILKINQKDMEFHRFLWEKTGSARRLRILQNLYSQLQMAMVIDTRLTGDLEKTVKDHYNIFQYLQAHDVEKSKEALRNHIELYVASLTDNSGTAL